MHTLLHLFRPGSWPHTIAGGLLIAALVIILPFLFAIL